MSRRNAFLAMQEEYRRASMEAMKKTTDQYLTDCATIALNRLGWGEKRIREFLETWGAVYNEFYDAIRDVPETDYCRAKMDECIGQICRSGDWTPFEQRYDYLKDVRY